MFLDEVIVQFSSGNGGSGAVAFHREKHVPRGGPNGADGGRGGDVILIADRGCRTLYDFKLRDKIIADSGSHALGNKRGRDGKDVEVKVPVGTVITDLTLDEVVADLNMHGLRFIMCKGGRGGFGNLHYVSSVRQVPNFAQKGAPGDTVRAKLELKLLADIGLIGLPNAGKSTLISMISAAKPKIADYPFTTIIPNLGVAKAGHETFVVADMPGLIEGASSGHGLGHQFLRHIERTRALVHVVDCLPVEETDPISNFQLVEKELLLYNPEISERPRLVALNKIDIIDKEKLSIMITKLEQFGYPVFPISAATGQGLEPLLFAMAKTIKDAEPLEAMPVLMPAKTLKMDDSWDIVQVDDGYEITGKRMLRMVAMTDLANKDGVRHLHRRLQRLGVIDKLYEMGAQEGDTVYVGDAVFNFSDW